MGEAGEYGKYDDSKIYTTYAGAIWSHKNKMDKKVHLGEMDFFIHLEMISMIFTDS